MTGPDNRATVGPKLAVALVFIASGAVLVLEIVSLRLVAPYVGLTQQTNTAVIGVALGAIALGAWSGGRVADIVDPRRLLGPLIVAGGALVLVVLPLVRWTGEGLQGGGAGAVLLIAMAAIFAPAALLSAITPLVVKLRLATLAQTGTIVGRLSGVGTLGSIAATFGTGFVLVALVPTSTILFVLGGLLLVVGLGVIAWIERGNRVLDAVKQKAVAGPLVLALVAVGATVAAPVRCDLETAYHCARILTDPQRPSGRILELDTLRHSYVDIDDPKYLEFGYIKAIASAVDSYWPAGEPVRVLHLGGGGLTMPRYLAAERPGTTNTVFEIDAGVLALDRSELGADDIAGTTVSEIDARVGIGGQADASQDLVIGDTFGGVAVPWHMATRELVAEVKRVLTPDGLYAVNIIDYPPLDFLRAELATIAAEFSTVTMIAPQSSLDGKTGGNFVVLATNSSLPLDAIAARLAERDGDLRVLDPARLPSVVGDARILTDDYAPVDQLLNPYG